MNDLLLKQGYITFQLFSPAEVAALSSQFDTELFINPLVSNSPTSRAAYVAKPAMSAFGALGDPWSFHMPVRNVIDGALHRWVFANLTHYGGKQRFFLHRDRAMVRTPGTSISGESWHTDNPPASTAVLVNTPHGDIVESHEHDITLGGWVSLSGRNAFCCCPGTHTLTRAKDANGFVPFTKEDGDRFSRECTTINVPPGHAILFYQNIVHCIKPGKVAVRTTRTFVGVSFTDARFSGFYRDLDRRLRHFSAMQLPSGQEPLMYESRHLMYWQDAIERYSANFIDKACESYVKKSNPRGKPAESHVKQTIQKPNHTNASPTKRFVQQKLFDLAMYVFPSQLPDEYTPEQRAMFFPFPFPNNEILIDYFLLLVEINFCTYTDRSAKNSTGNPFVSTIGALFTSSVPYLKDFVPTAASNVPSSNASTPSRRKP